MDDKGKVYFQNAEWIFVKDIPKDVFNTYFDYQTEFSLKQVDGVKLHLCASTLYAVYINEVFVDCGQYAGYEDYQVYDSLDITRFVHLGKNTLKIVHYVLGKDFLTNRAQLPGLIFSVWQNDRCIVNSNVDVLSRKNTCYRDGQMELSNDVMGFVVKYDACAAELPYQNSVIADKEKHLFPRPIDKVVIEETVTGKMQTHGIFVTDGKEKNVGRLVYEAYLSARQPWELAKSTEQGTIWQIREDDMADGVYFLLDMEQESAGYLSLDFEVPEACDVWVGFGEHLVDLRVRSGIKVRNFAVSYHAHPGRNRFFEPFQRLGLRYMQVHIASRQGVLYSAGIRESNYPLQIQPNPIQDHLHHRIYDVAVRTLHLCMHEHYEDCPWREQSLYAFDSRVQMLCGYYAFKEYRFAKASLRLLAKTLRSDGVLDLGAPGTFPITIPSFTTIFIRQLMEYMEHSGDTEFIREVFDCAKAIVDNLEHRIDDTGLIPSFAGKQYWNFYAWNEGLTGTEYFTENPPYECPLNAFASDSFYCFARLCDAVAPEQAAHYDALHEQLNQRLHEAFFDTQRNVYISRLNADTEILHAFTQVLALYVGATPDALRPVVVQNMLGENMIPCMLSARTYEYDVLLQMGDTYRDFVRKDVENTWGKMLFAGATTFWEVEEGPSYGGNAGSLCHGWSAVPIYLYGKYDLLREA